MDSAAALRVIGAFIIIVALLRNVVLSHKSGTAPNARDAARLSRQFNSGNGLIIAVVVLQIAVIDLTVGGRPANATVFIQTGAVICLLANTLLILQPSGRSMVATMERTAEGIRVDERMMRCSWLTRWISFTVNTVAALAVAFSFLF